MIKRSMPLLWAALIFAVGACGPSVLVPPIATSSPRPQPTRQATAAKPVTLTIISEESEGRYRVREQLVTLTLPNDAVGSTGEISGTIVIGSDGAVNREQSKVVVDVRTLKSDRLQRDRYLQRELLETSRYPMVTFIPTEIRGLSGALPTSGEQAVEMVGDLVVKEMTRSVTWQGTARFNDSEVELNATLVTTFSELGLKKPSVAILLGVEDRVQLEADLKLTRSADAGAGPS